MSKTDLLCAAVHQFTFPTIRPLCTSCVVPLLQCQPRDAQGEGYAQCSLLKNWDLMTGQSTGPAKPRDASSSPQNHPMVN